MGHDSRPAAMTIRGLRKRLEELEQELARGHNVGCNEALSEAQARAEKAERERDDAREEAQNDYKALWEQDTAALQADLDAALDCCEILGVPFGRALVSGDGRKIGERVLSLLEKRRENRG